MVKAIRSEPARVSVRGTVDQGTARSTWGRPGGARGGEWIAGTGRFTPSSAPARARGGRVAQVVRARS